MLKKRRKFTNQRHFDIDGYHPNIIPRLNSPKKWLDYVRKHGDYVCLGDQEPFEKQRLKDERKKVFKSLITKEKTIVQVVEEDPCFLNNYKRLYQDLSLY